MTAVPFCVQWAGLGWGRGQCFPLAEARLMSLCSGVRRGREPPHLWPQAHLNMRQSLPVSLPVLLAPKTLWIYWIYWIYWI